MIDKPVSEIRRTDSRGYTAKRNRKSLTSRDKMASMVTWLPLVRAAAVGWVPLSANPIPLSGPVILFK